MSKLLSHFSTCIVSLNHLLKRKPCSSETRLLFHAKPVIGLCHSFVGCSLPLQVTSFRSYLCRARAHTDSLSSVRQSLSISLSKLSSQICEWHVSLHLARTCIAYGDCIMALGLSNAALQHYSNTWGEVTRGRETNRLCKSIKMAKQLQLHSLTLWKQRGKNRRNSQSSLNTENLQRQSN